MDVVFLFLLRDRDLFKVICSTNMCKVDAPMFGIKDFESPFFSFFAVFDFKARVGVHCDFGAVPFLNIPEDLVETGNKCLRCRYLDFTKICCERSAERRSRMSGSRS